MAEGEQGVSQPDKRRRGSAHSVIPDPSFRPIGTAPSAFLTSLRASLPPGSTTMREDGRVLTWRPHRLAIEVHAGLYDTPAGPAHVVESQVPIAQNVGDRTYLAMLALYVRRLDPIGTLALDDAGQLASHVRMFFTREYFTPSERDDAACSILVTQALHAELLERDGMLAGLLSLDDLAPTSITGTYGPQDRPDSLFSANAELAQRGMQALSMVTLEGSSKLGPWFVGTRQDELLSDRMQQGWQRLPNRDQHGVRLVAPDSVEHVAEIRINWAHHSSLFGPALLLAVVSRLPLGRHPGKMLQQLSRIPDSFAARARTGTWLPESWVHPGRAGELANTLVHALHGSTGDPNETLRLLDLPRQRIRADDRATFIVAMPTALSAPGALATVWEWAEEHVVDAVQGSARSLN